MANRERGEWTVEVEAKTYRLQFSINAMCEVEEMLSTPGKRIGFNTFLTEYLPDGRYLDQRLAMWAALREHHPEITVAEAGWVIDRIGWNRAAAGLAALLNGTQPDAEDLRALGVPEQPNGRPPKARQAGTGGPSTSRPARSGSPRATSGT
jgi:hypothetical protein